MKTITKIIRQEWRFLTKIWAAQFLPHNQFGIVPSYLRGE